MTWGSGGARPCAGVNRALVAVAVALGAAAATGTAHGAKVDTFTVSGKYHGTLTLTNPGADCFIDEFSSRYLSDSVKLDPLTGSLSGLAGKDWFFLATEPRQGTFVTKATNQATSAKIRPVNANDTIAFSQTSGTITFDGKTGSASMTMVFNNGYENTVTVTVSGSWSCPVVHHL